MEEILNTNLSWPCGEPNRHRWEETQALLQSIDAALDKGLKPHTNLRHMPRFYEVLDLLRYQRPELEERTVDEPAQSAIKALEQEAHTPNIGSLEKHVPWPIHQEP